MSSRNINVVIVGGSTAGLRAAKTIASLSTQGYTNLSITIIDKNEYYFHAIGAPRSIVDAEFGKKLFVPLKDIVDGMQASSSQSKHQFIHSTLTSINDNHTITLSNGQTLVYDYLVLATGARNRTPAHYDGTTVAEAQSNVIKVYENIKKAHDILIIGGGAVGVEMAGEIAGAYPDKKITLINSVDSVSK
ncbi:hypothetical protein GGI07_003760 [Coemansia sp. Benny D115]|nr:hypothetical protein GGI07_003760 [Coemansia sp. Benny D115]